MLKNITIFQEIFCLKENYESKNKENNFIIHNLDDLKPFWKSLSIVEKEQIFLIQNEKLIDYGIENMIYLHCYQGKKIKTKIIESNLKELFFQIIDPEEIINEFNSESFVSLIAEFIFIFKSSNNLRSNFENNDFLSIPKNFKIFFSNDELLSCKKNFKAKLNKMDNIFEIIQNFLSKYQITNCISLKNESRADFIEEILSLMIDKKKNEEVFYKFFNGVEYFLSICFVFFIDNIFELFYKKQSSKLNYDISQPEYEQNNKISEMNFNFMDYSKSFIYQNLTKRAIIHRLTIRLDDESYLQKKTPKNNIYEDIQNDEDLVILKILQDQEKNKFITKDLKNIQMAEGIKPFFLNNNNLMDNLHEMAQNNELLNNLLQSSNQMITTTLFKINQNHKITHNLAGLMKQNSPTIVDHLQNFNFLKAFSVLQQNSNNSLRPGFLQNHMFITDNGIQLNQKNPLNNYYNVKINNNSKKKTLKM